MMLIYKRLVLSLAFVFGALLIVVGQKGYELGGWIGTSYYYGDLNTTLKIVQPGLAGGLIGRYNFNHRVNARLGLSMGKVGANDAVSDNRFEKGRNLQFESLLGDLSGVIEFNFFHYEHGHPTYNKTPYFFGGVNLTYFNPTATLNDVRYSLRKMGTEGQPLGQEYGTITGGLILGGGFKFDLNRHVSLNVEISTRFLFTDYLDDVSTVFPDKVTLRDTRGEIAVSLADRSLIDGIGDAGRQRGDSKGNDRYVMAGIGIVRYFGGIACPEISRIRD
jgi:hypothetical protein